MKRWFLTVVAVLGPTVGLVSADYVILKVDLNKFFASDPGQAGAKPPPKGKDPGTQPGVPPGTEPGGYPGGLPPGGPPGGGGYPGGYPEGYPGGQPGGLPPGGVPPGGMPGGVPGQPGDPNNPNAGGAERPPEAPPLWAYACIELKKTPAYYQQQNLLVMDQKWGKPILVPGVTVFKYVKIASASKRFDEEVRNRLKGGKTAGDILGLAAWALERGLLPEFHRMVEDLRKVDETHPALKTIDAAREAMKAKPAKDDPTAASFIEELTRQDYRAVPSEQGHFVLYSNVKLPGNDPSVKRRLARMEETYQTFFYWFALKGKLLTVPDYRLVSVMVKADATSTREFDSTHVIFDSVPMVADGFHARRDNLVVMSSRRLDEAYTMLAKNNLQMWQNQFKVSMDDLLKDAKIVAKRQDLGRILPWLQTMAVIQLAMEEESENATVTHETVRQLVAATGLIPRNIATAEWAQFGLGSFFETPHLSFHPTPAGANTLQLVNFRMLRKNDKITTKNAKEVLLNVISDRYFRAALEAQREAADDAEGKGKLALKAKDKTDMARATAWALTHFLTRDEQLPKLQRYLDELKKLPRDAEFDAAVLERTFARAFGLTRESGDSGKVAIDQDRLERLAHKWLSAMEDVHLDDIGLEGDLVKFRVSMAQLAEKLANQPPVATQPGTGGTPPYGPPGPMPPYGPPGGKTPGYNPYPPGGGTKTGPGGGGGGTPGYNPYGPGGASQPPMTQPAPQPAPYNPYGGKQSGGAN